jgi:hypothetical protein
LICGRKAIKGVRYFVHDTDLSTKKEIENYGLKCGERFDFNHHTKNLFQKARTQGNILYGLYPSLRSNFVHCMREINNYFFFPSIIDASGNITVYKSY